MPLMHDQGEYSKQWQKCCGILFISLGYVHAALQGIGLLTGVLLAMRPTVVDFYGGNDVEGTYLHN